MAVNFSIIFGLAQICVFCLGISPNTYTNRGYVYNDQINGWLKLHSNPDEWLDARISCNFEGATLVLPWTGEFVSAVKTLQSQSGISTVYSGVHITQTAYYDGLYGYLGGSPSILVEPNHSRLKLCGVLNANGTMGEVNCKEKLPYVCYAPEEIGAGRITTPTPTPTTTSTTITTTTPKPTPPPKPTMEYGPLGYEYNSQTGHWYKFHAEQVIPWKSAREACRSEGALLAVPNSDEEAKYLIGLHARYLDKEIANTDWPDWVAVGVYWDNGVWMTVDGQKLAESGYLTWKTGWPGNDHYNYPYVVMDRGGRYSTTYSILYPYVCEKTHV